MITRQLYSSPMIGVAEFLHSPHDGTWMSLRPVVSDVPLVIFPRNQVEIRHADEAPVLAGPNLAMLYNPGELYSRHPASPDGDHYVEFQVGPAVAAELETEVDTVRGGRLRGTHVPAEPAVYLHQHLLTRYLKSGGSDQLLVQETALRIVRNVLTGTVGHLRARRDSTRARHRELAEAAKRELAASLAVGLSLEELARRVGYSPYHLARVFRRETGYALHEYLLQLRLREGLERLPGAAGSLSPLALELGFVSHSHFTTAFTREFGLPPTAVRDQDQVRRILEAARPLAA